MLKQHPNSDAHGHLKVRQTLRKEKDLNHFLEVAAETRSIGNVGPAGPAAPINCRRRRLKRCMGPKGAARGCQFRDTSVRVMYYSEGSGKAVCMYVFILYITVILQ